VGQLQQFGSQIFRMCKGTVETHSIVRSIRGLHLSVDGLLVEFSSSNLKVVITEEVKMRIKSSIATQITLTLILGIIASVFTNPVLAEDEEEGTVLDVCMETFWNMYEETLRDELGAKFDFAECGKVRNMPYVSIGVTLTACEDAVDPTTNFVVRGPEPKAYLHDFKVEKECSIQGPISCGEDSILNISIEIQFEEDGALGEWKKFVRDDVCDLVMADYAADQEP
jgi:hypothetical protein